MARRAAQHYTFPALVTTDERIQNEPNTVAAAIRAIRRAQQVLRADPTRATQVGQRLFPSTEASLIAQLIERDLPYYQPEISEEAVSNLNGFARNAGFLSAPVPYDRVVATQFSHLWTE